MTLLLAILLVIAPCMWGAYHFGWTRGYGAASKRHREMFETWSWQGTRL